MPLLVWIRGVTARPRPASRARGDVKEGAAGNATRAAMRVERRSGRRADASGRGDVDGARPYETSLGEHAPEGDIPIGGLDRVRLLQVEREAEQARAV
jgi:hypothetical protein